MLNDTAGTVLAQLFTGK